ncbi:MAG: hypothetical protein RLO81_12185 [Fulvivirga sp.]|uniref:hypothetical protein n=1 Tax=Fulvivirga sp. TaxID=1931237 RepID=UPI0032EC4FCD
MALFFNVIFHGLNFDVQIIIRRNSKKSHFTKSQYLILFNSKNLNCHEMLGMTAKPNMALWPLSLTKGDKSSLSVGAFKARPPGGSYQIGTA